MSRRFDSTAIVFGIATVILLAFSLFVTFHLAQPVIGLCLLALFAFDVVILGLLLRTPKTGATLPRRAEEAAAPVVVVPKRTPMVADDPDELDPEEYPDYLR